MYDSTICSKAFFLVTDMFGLISYKRINESIGFNLDDLTKLMEFGFKDTTTLEIKNNETSNIIFIIFPNEYVSKMYIHIVDEIEEKCKDSYLVPANKSKYIFCDDRIQYSRYYNHITTFTSSKNNLKFFFIEKMNQLII